ncbi:ankyrin repeat-containing domain protein [Aspergillus pseudoustus]|uniref:Ankyrin repeat-containing domain protein n=1 Tax=Aspergillus pseudoustus TaxID=1810923 RepID=A0ABR4K487_9EURO
MVPSLIDGGAVVDARDNTDMTPLHLAAVVGHTRSAQILIENGADILANTPYSSGRAQKAILGRVDALLGHRENARLASALRAVIHLAVEEVQLPHAIRLGIHKMALTIETDLEVPPWALLAMEQLRLSVFRSEVFEILRDSDIFLDNGWTPLHIAAYNGREDFVRLIVQHGAPVDALTARELSAIQIAGDRAHRNIVQILKELGSNIDYSHRDLVEENRVQERARREEEMRLVSALFAFEEGMAELHLATR